MSTRSSKKKHSSIHESTQSQRMTRSRRFKENIEESSVSVVKIKNRPNYVSYPTDDEVRSDTVNSEEEEPKPTRTQRKNVLNQVTNVVKEGAKPKNEKKKKKSKKVKKAKTSGSMVVEDIVPENGEKESANKSNMSVESFHSAADSPLKCTPENTTSAISPVKALSLTTAIKSNNDTAHKPEVRHTRSTTRTTSINNHTQISLDSVVKVSRKRKSSFKEFDTTLTNISKKRKSSIRGMVPERTNTTIDGDIEASTLEELERRKSAIKEVINTTYEKSETPKCDVTFDKELSTNKNSTRDINQSTPFTTPTSQCIELVSRKSAIINTTYEKDSNTDTNEDRKSSIINDTYDKNEVSSDILSEDEDSNTNVRKSTQKEQKQSTELNSTYDKTAKSDSTFDKDKNPDSTLNKNKVLDTTFDKNSKSSLITSDNSNITLDKSDVSRISITSDDSKDNIVNTTPVLIESSLDESRINSSKLKTPEKSITIAQTPATPLIREGTYIKDGTDIIETEINVLRTPTRKMSLPSPGCTPFPKESLMNRTRSIEKPRRSSLCEPHSRATRVTFCSPVTNPVLAAQQQRKVIKSNLKGSNKKFVFENTGPERRAAAHKRSLSHNDAGEARAKRHRLADGSQPARLPRTPSSRSAAKSTDPGTSSKKTTKLESKVSRTKLPNFFALHQREFAKMESLDECQERKARRARQLLTPTGPVAVLERSSPRETDKEILNKTNKSPNLEDSKVRTAEKPRKETKKPVTPIKSLPTLKSLNPGYSRFGFKLNCDVNPFSVPCKSDNKSQLPSSKKNVKKDVTRPLKEIRGLKRQATLPSIAVSISSREVAKQTVMREKSHTEKRNKTRDENRTVIKGVRTNRRFELQMKMRNLD